MRSFLLKLMAVVVFVAVCHDSYGQELQSPKFEKNTATVSQPVSVQERRIKDRVFRRAVINAARQEYRQGGITREQFRAIRDASYSPDAVEGMRNVALSQLAASGEVQESDVNIPTKDGKIVKGEVSWANLIPFLIKLLPFLLEFLEDLGILD